LPTFFRDANIEKSNMKIGFATYDQTVHFYNLSNKTSRPEMLIVNDVNDIFVPFVDGFFVDVIDAEIALVKLVVLILELVSIR
jgi:protein transport protein SEC24